MGFKLTPEEFVATLYRSALGRPPDADGLAYWSGVIRTTGDYTSVLAGFVESEEFGARDRSTVIRPSPDLFTGGSISVPYGSIAALAIDQSLAGLPSGVDVVVPVCNAERWISRVCDGYDALRLRPLFIVEARSTDKSLAILLARNARVFTAQGKKPYVESLLSGIIPYLSSRWVLRLDDDELPSSAMLRWIAGNVEDIGEQAVAFPRLWVHRNRCAGWETTDCKGVGGAWGADHQTRLFRPAAVTPTGTIHTPGFEASTILAPSEARIYHLDWIVRGYNDRLEKIEHYERLEKGKGNRFAAYYLPEEHDPTVYAFVPLDDTTIERVCEHLEILTSQEPNAETTWDECERFEHLGVRLELPKRLVSPPIRRAFREGYYEALEAQLIGRLLRPSDIVLELGAAVGFLSTWISQRLTTGRLISYEANPTLIDVAAKTFRLNDVRVTLKSGVVIGASACKMADFFVDDDFWASSQIASGRTRIEVPAYSLSGILQEVKPNILVVDVEGGELTLFEHADLNGIRHAVVELHVKVIGRSGIERVFRRLSDLGFAYDPEFSSSHVVTFTPVGEI